MTNHTILFLLRKNKINKKNECPIECRITYLGKRKPFSTGLFINPINWNSKVQKAKPPSSDNNYINSQLSLIKTKINQAFLLLQAQEKSITAIDIYNQYSGVNLNKDKSVIDIFNFHIKKQEKLIGISTTKNSIDKFHQTKKHLQSFILNEFNKNDFLLKDLKINFITEFEFYLKSEKKFMQHTIYKTIQRFRQIIKLAVAMDYIFKDPFMLYKNLKPKKEIVYLTPEELTAIENYEFVQKRLWQIKDLFVFCCYTGLGYQEMFNLKKSNLVKRFDNKIWIQMLRQKTSKELLIPLLPKSITIIEKYSDVDNIYALPRISNQRFNSYLKEIAEIVGIEKKLTHHIARKTFATSILLYNDVPMEIVSELLGHSRMSITQEHYGKVVQKKVSEHITTLIKKLKKNSSN